jgi:hypothetical protein
LALAVYQRRSSRQSGQSYSQRICKTGWAPDGSPGGISQAANGDLVGIINAIGNPIAADAALPTLASGFESIVVFDAARSIVRDFSKL